jgi:nucleoside-diphosphate-sugar epimerase
MRILVTGATGFVGGHIIPTLLARGHEVVATSRSSEKAQSKPWFNQVDHIPFDTHKNDKSFYGKLHNIDAVIHLAWQGLPDYKGLFHFEENLPTDYAFIKALVGAGIKNVLVTGTCFEYGMVSGALAPEMPTYPENSYGLAKDTLRKCLQELQKTRPFRLKWVRLFYMYGEGQNPQSLLAQLDTAIDNGDKTFNMSGGEQLRDFLHIADVAINILNILETDGTESIFNCCSGNPTSVRALVEKRIEERNASIDLNLGYYPYPDYEPMAFWGKTED